MSGTIGANRRDEWRGADRLVQALAAAGTTHVFTLSGNQIMSVFDALIEAPLQLVHTRHEAAAIHAADAVGRLSGRPGVALVTAGPGFANTLSALYVARCAESPLVLLSGAAPLAQAGRGAFQDMPQAAMAAPVTKRSWTVTDVAAIATELERAFALATSGRPGPVHLALPVDILEAVAPDGAAARGSLAAGAGAAGAESESVATTAELDQICRLVRAARRPLLLAGPPLRRGPAVAALQQLSARTGLPAVAMDSPRGLRDPALGALSEPIAEADLIVLLGKRLDHTLSQGAAPPFAAACRFIHIDPEQDALDQTRHILGRDERLAACRLGDCHGWVAALTSVGEQLHADAGWTSAVKAAVDYRPPEWDALAGAAKQGGGAPIAGSPAALHPVAVSRAVDQFLAEDRESVFVCDGGEVGQWAQACVSTPRRVINGPSGAIGGCLPFALGARAVYPQARIVALLGDGTFGFHAMELDTALRHQLPFIAVVGNDAAWNAEVQIQRRQYGPDRVAGCHLLPTRYDQLASALGGHGTHVAAGAELAPALRAAYATGLPACINVPITSAAAPLIRR